VEIWCVNPQARKFEKRRKLLMLTILSSMNHVMLAGGAVLSKVQLAAPVSPALK